MKSKTGKRAADAMGLRLELEIRNLNALERAVLKRYGKIEAGITRDVIAPADMSLHALHFVIQKVFGWRNSHLHHFTLPGEVFQAMLNVPRNEVRFMEWAKLCGVYFRFPSDAMGEYYLGDNYTGEQSIEAWMRGKYSGPYRYLGIAEHYMELQMTIRDFCQENPELRRVPSFEEWSAQKGKGSVAKVMKPVGEMTVDEMERVLGTGFDHLLERLSLAEVLLPGRKKAQRGWQEAVRQLADQQQTAYEANLEALVELHRRMEDTEQSENAGSGNWSCEQYLASMEYYKKMTAIDGKVMPVAHRLDYAYDYGDGWAVKITCPEAYWLDADGAGVLDAAGQPVSDGLREQVAAVSARRRPLCVAADGLNVMDDVGGVYGYMQFLATLNGGDRGEARDQRDWAREQGWTGRAIKPERML